MKNNIGEIIGVQHGESKDAKRPWTKLHLIGEFDEFMNNTNGKCVLEVYANGAFPVKLGDKVEVKYSPGFQGKAQVTGVVVL